MSEEDQEVIQGQDGESTEETVQEVAQEVVKPPRGLIYVDLNEDQTRIMPGRPEKNMMEDEKGESGKIKFDDENIVGDTTMARRRNFVKQILNINNDEVRGDIFVDYMANAVLFCQENKFSDEQTSAFFAIAKRTFHTSKGDESTQLTGSSFLKRDDAYKAFHKLLLQHSVEKPPESVKIFTKDEVKKVTIFMTSTYFRLYKTYEIAFTQEQELRRLPLDVVVETPLRPTPLTAAQEVPRPVPKKIVEEQPEEIENSNNIDNNDENKMDEGGKTEEMEEMIEVPEHLQEIVNKKVQEEQERLKKEIEDMTNTLDKKRLLLVNDEEEVQGENDNNMEKTEDNAETVVVE